MPTNHTHQHQVRQSSSSSSSPMAVAVDHHHQPHGFKPWKRRSRLHSSPHPSLIYDFSSPALPQPLVPFFTRRRHFKRSFSTPCFTYHDHNQQQQKQEICSECADSIGSCRAIKGTKALVVETVTTLSSIFRCVPVPASSGLGGAYFLRKNSGEYFAVIKPIGDDPLSLGRLSAYAGETSLREVAAYFLDHGGFSGVPPTALINIPYSALDTITATTVSSATSKVASIQRFVPHDFDAGDIGPSMFSVASVHRIGILDVRLLNIDRHAGNILVKKHIHNTNQSSTTAELIPIDHGLCLPEVLDAPYFEWLHWPQSVIPFSEQELEYMSLLDPFKDADLLHAKLPSLKEPAIRIMILCTIFLKQAAVEGFCLADIGDMMTREFCGLEEGSSMLEALCKEAIDTINFGINNDHEDEENDIHDKTLVQFEMDFNDGRCLESCSSSDEVMQIPLFLKSKVQIEKERWNEYKVSGALGEEEEEETVEAEATDVVGQVEEKERRFCNEDDEEPNLGNLAKSMSMSAADFLYESGGCSSDNSISFSGMSEEEWDLFLDRFEQLLPKAFVKRKGMGMNHRLGSSCKF